MEIEKKYKVKRLPEDLGQYQKLEIEQGYLCREPVVRVRKSEEDYILTYKSRIGVEKEAGRYAKVLNEIEAPLSKSGYEHLKQKIDFNLVEKDRYLIPLSEGLKVELDLFKGRLEGLVIAEVEFPDESRARDFAPPDWFGEEVSHDERYTNRYLSEAGEPELASLIKREFGGTAHYFPA